MGSSIVAGYRLAGIAELLAALPVERRSGYGCARASNRVSSRREEYLEGGGPTSAEASTHVRASTARSYARERPGQSLPRIYPQRIVETMAVASSNVMTSGWKRRGFELPIRHGVSLVVTAAALASSVSDRSMAYGSVVLNPTRRWIAKAGSFRSGTATQSVAIQPFELLSESPIILTASWFLTD
jgi:hypothetical protein